MQCSYSHNFYFQTLHTRIIIHNTIGREFLFLICARDTSTILPVIPPKKLMLIMFTMDKIFRDINYNIVLQCI